MNADQAAKIQSGFRLLQAGKLEEALAAARAAVAAAPDSADAHHILALCAKALGDDATAETAFRQALEIEPENAEILVNLGNWFNKSGRAANALMAYERAVNAAPGLAQAWINLGISTTHAGQFDRARTALSTALELDPKSGAAWQAMGYLCRVTRDLAGAEHAFRQATTHAPGVAQNWISLGVVLRFLGRPAEALPCYAKASALGFKGPELADAESACRIDMGDVAGALAQVRALNREFPGYTAGHATLAHLLWEHGGAVARDEDPFAGLRAAAHAQPQNWPLQVALVRMLVEARKADEALAQIQLLKTRPGAPSMTVFEANALEILGRSNDARALYEEAYRQQGEANPAFMGAYIFHLFRAQRIEQAAEHAYATAQRFPEHQEAWAYLSTAWRLLNDPREHWLCDYERLISLVEVHPPEGYADGPAFMAALRGVLEPMHKATREPLHQSLRGGSQTPGRLFGRDDAMIQAASRALLAAADRWVATLPNDPSHPFLSRKRPHVREVGSWSVKLWSTGRHVNHVHPEGWMSSAFYVSLPPSVGRPGDNRQAGWIQFGQPQEELNIDLPARRMIQPKEGWLALFPSYMWHGTVPFDDEAPRMTIAFDMQPTG